MTINIALMVSQYALAINAIRQLALTSQARVDALKALVSELDALIPPDQFKGNWKLGFNFETIMEFHDTFSLECNRFSALSKALYDSLFEGLDIRNYRPIWAAANRVCVLCRIAIEEYEISVDAEMWEPLLDDSSLAE